MPLPPGSDVIEPLTSLSLIDFVATGFLMSMIATTRYVGERWKRYTNKPKTVAYGRQSIYNIESVNQTYNINAVWNIFSDENRCFRPILRESIKTFRLSDQTESTYFGTFNDNRKNIIFLKSYSEFRWWISKFSKLHWYYRAQLWFRYSYAEYLPYFDTFVP